jgi:putative transposase
MGRVRRDVRIGVPHHVVHRGNHQSDLFASDADRCLYLSLVQRFSRTNGVGVAGFCLMRNHVHFIVVPSSLKSISRCFGQAHRKYSEFLNARSGTFGTNWEGRFFSEPMSESHAVNALRYIERNPVAAGIVTCATDWEWSSAGTHCARGKRWPFIDRDVRGTLADPDRWSETLGLELEEHELQTVTWLFRARSIDAGLEAAYS